MTISWIGGPNKTPSDRLALALAAGGIGRPPPAGAPWSRRDRTAFETAEEAIIMLLRQNGPLPVRDYDAIAGSIANARRRITSRDPTAWPALPWRPDDGAHPGVDLTPPIGWGAVRLQQDLNHPGADFGIARSRIANLLAAITEALDIARVGGQPACCSRKVDRAISRLEPCLRPIFSLIAGSDYQTCLPPARSARVRHAGS